MCQQKNRTVARYQYNTLSHYWMNEKLHIVQNKIAQQATQEKNRGNILDMITQRWKVISDGKIVALDIMCTNSTWEPKYYKIIICPQIPPWVSVWLDCHKASSCASSSCRDQANQSFNIPWATPLSWPSHFADAKITESHTRISWNPHFLDHLQTGHHRCLNINQSSMIRQ